MHCKTKADATSSTIEHLVTHIFGWWVQRVCLWDAKRNRKYFCVWFVLFHRTIFFLIRFEVGSALNVCAISDFVRSAIHFSLCIFFVCRVHWISIYTINENNHHAARYWKAVENWNKKRRSVAWLHTWMHFSTYEMNLTSKPQQNHRQPRHQHQHPKRRQRLQSLQCDEPVCGRANLSLLNSRNKNQWTKRLNKCARFRGFVDLLHSFYFTKCSSSFSHSLALVRLFVFDSFEIHFKD